MKKIEIWMEGYSATGENGHAQKIWETNAENFDDAISQYNDYLAKKYGDNYNYFAEPYTRNSFSSDEHFINRRSNWKIWGCALFDNETNARKSFG